MNAKEDMPLVSVVIPCYNHGHFLPEAIESVYRQSYRYFEIVVVDDGSMDNTSSVAAGYDDLQYVWQTNRGLPAARNTGLRESKGQYLVFLDADDRLRPEALEMGIKAHKEHHGCAFVFGGHVFIAADGSPVASPSEHCIDVETYPAYLKGRSSIGNPATVMYRRDAIESVGGFNPFLKACEDYDLYLRIVQRYPIRRHHTVVAEYRRHSTNMSRDCELMLRSSVGVLKSHRKYVTRSKEYLEAYNAGIKYWQNVYGDPLVEQVLGHLKSRSWKEAARGVLTLRRYYPYGLRQCAYRCVRKTVVATYGRLRFG